MDFELYALVYAHFSWSFYSCDSWKTRCLSLAIRENNHFDTFCAITEYLTFETGFILAANRTE